MLTFGVAAPVSYWQSAKAEAKARQGQPLNNAENFVRKNPFLTSLGATFTARSLSKGITKSFKGSGEAESAGFWFSKKNLPGKTFTEKRAELNRLEYLRTLEPETVNLIYNEIIS